MRWLYARERTGGASADGESSDRGGQTDVVGLRDDGVIDLGECKWGAVQSARALEKELDDKIPLFPNSKKASLVRRVFVRTKVSPPAGSKVAWHSLADLYEDD